MTNRPWTASTALFGFGFGACLLVACGGRYQTLREVEDDPVSGVSGAASAGRGSAGSSRAGASSGGLTGVGGTSAAGAPSSAGAGGAKLNCAGVKCASIACPPGSAPRFEPGACCATSCTGCSSSCPAIECAPGHHFERIAGNCCPVCVDDGGAACQKGRQEYAVQREAILNKYQFGCASNSECVVLAPVNLCERGCSAVAVWYGASDSFDSNLSNAADTYCSSCQVGPTPPCDPPYLVECVLGVCQLSTVK